MPVTVYNLAQNLFVQIRIPASINVPIVKKGQKVKAGEIIADGPATDTLRGT